MCTLISIRCILYLDELYAESTLTLVITKLEEKLGLVVLDNNILLEHAHKRATVMHAHTPRNNII